MKLTWGVAGGFIWELCKRELGEMCLGSERLGRSAVGTKGWDDRSGE